MEVFVRDVPEQITEKGLRNLIGPYMEKLSIQTYLCGKQRQKRFAFVTFLHVEDGQRFLQAHGKDKVLPTLRVMVPIKLLGSQVTCSLSNAVVNAHSVRSLAKEEKDRISQAKKPAVQIPKAKPDTATAFACRSVRVRILRTPLQGSCMPVTEPTMRLFIFLFSAGSLTGIPIHRFAIANQYP